MIQNSNWAGKGRLIILMLHILNTLTSMALVTQLVRTNCPIVHMMGRLSSPLAPFTLPEW